MKRYKLLICLVLLATTILSAQNWPSFRGENAAGIATGSVLPISWNVESGKNVLWEQKIPGSGHASPIIWEDRIYIATANPSEKTMENAAKTGNAPIIEWWLMCLDKKTGKLIWSTMATASKPRASHHPKANQCNSTPATDGNIIAAIMGSQGLFCFDISGKLLWQKDLGLLDPGLASDPSSQWGHGSSPIIYQGKIIVQIDKHSDSYIAAFDTKSGKETWRQKRDELPSWSTPIVAVVGTKAQIVTNGGNVVRGYDAKNGRVLWSFSDTAQVKVPTPLLVNEQIIVTGGYPRGRPIVSLPLTLSGKITDEQLNWKLAQGGPYTVSPIAYRDLIYSCTDLGVISCIDSKTGDLVYRQRLNGNYSASPIAANGYLYLASEDGEIQVIKTGSEFELLETNQMPSGCFATPAVSAKMLFIRTTDTLYCIGESK